MAEEVDPLSVNPPVPAGRGPGSLAPFSEHESDEVGVPPEVEPGEMVVDDVRVVEDVDVVAGAGLAEREVEATVVLPGASVVVSADELSTPFTSVTIMVSPSVTVVSGTPPSVVGAGGGAV